MNAKKSDIKDACPRAKYFLLRFPTPNTKPDPGEASQQSLTLAKPPKLVGVAPINRDSGSKSGKRFIGGGRGNVRRVLYMAAVVGIRHNPVLKAYYVHLKSKGKESKVAIVACMRKLLSIMNMMVRKDETWREMSKGGAS